jgi:hypothetical protein
MATDPTTPAPPSRDTHPYAIHVSLTLGSNVELELSEDGALFPFANDCTIRLVKEHALPREQANYLQRVSVHLEGFSTACEAERAGKLLVLSLLWVAASKRVTIAFEKWTGEFPFAVRDRTQSAGASSRAEGRVHFDIKPEEFSTLARKAYEFGRDVEPSLLTSMEFYASARAEATERACFIGLMTALEALSVQRDYGDEITKLLTDLSTQLEDSPLLAGEEKAPVRSSLSGRLRELCRESVRQAIKRTVSDYINDHDTIKFVDEAYGVRCKILHEGLKATELHVLTHRLEDVIRQIYSEVLGLPLDSPVHPV